VSEEENLDLDSFAKKYREKLTNHKALPDWYVRKAILNDMQELVQETSKEDLIASGQGIPEPLVIYGLDDPEMTKLLIAKGMDVNAPNWFGKTALMYAAQWNMPQMVKLLIETHADVNAATTPVGQQVCDSGPTITGRTALMYAAENASLPVIQTLLDAGADKTKKDSTNRRAWNYLMGNRLQVVNPNLKGNDLETAKQLLEFDVSKE
jgi:ankyrin repeat protein